jgi:aarF domain-containing kinase
VLDLYRGISEADAEAIAGAMVSVGMTKRSVDKALLAKDLSTVFDIEAQLEVAQDGSEHLLEKGAQRQLSALLGVATRHGIRFPSAFTLLLKQLLYFDRYLDLLAPGTDLFNGDFFDFGSLSLSDFDQALGDNTHININA